jgi:hypothetical protein
VDMAGKPKRRASPLTRATLSRDMASATKAASQRQEHAKQEWHGEIQGDEWSRMNQFNGRAKDTTVPI